MDPLVRLDRRLIAALARPLRRWQQATALPVHAMVFWSTAGLHLLAWMVLCAVADQPEWVWYIVAAAAGAAGGYGIDHEPVAQLEPGVALTVFGLESRWAMGRLAYVALAVVFFLPLIAGGEFGLLAQLLLGFEVLSLLVMEYLLAFRLADAVPTSRIVEALGDLERAAKELGYQEPGTEHG